MRTQKTAWLHYTGTQAVGFQNYVLPVVIPTYPPVARYKITIYDSCLVGKIIFEFYDKYTFRLMKIYVVNIFINTFIVTI